MAIREDVVFLAERVFSLQPPFSRDELKTAFRREAKKLHTDTSGKDTKEDFIKMKEAYDVILSFDDFFINGASPAGVLVTTDGTPLSELGLGLGPMKNGADCPRCTHKGYEEDRIPGSYSSHRCTDCIYGFVEVEIPCKPCGGTGKFTQRRSGRIVTCRVCHGTKSVLREQICPKCRGTQWFSVKVGGERVIYYRCFKCGGSGEIELFNPVLPKGRLFS